MKSPECRTIKGKIVDIKPGHELARDYPNPIAIVKARYSIQGRRETRNIWYPLNLPQEQTLEVGQAVAITSTTRKSAVGKGSLTTSTIRAL